MFVYQISSWLHATYHRLTCEHCDAWVVDRWAHFGFHGHVVCRSTSARYSSRVLIKVVSRTCDKIGVSHTSRDNIRPLKLSIEVKILHHTERCAIHSLAHETVHSAYRSERSTVYPVPSDQIFYACVRAFSSAFSNLHLHFLPFFRNQSIF